jgi:hypothetical protein
MGKKDDFIPSREICQGFSSVHYEDVQNQIGINRNDGAPKADVLSTIMRQFLQQLRSRG